MGGYQTKMNIFICGDLRDRANCEIIFNELFPPTSEQVTTGYLYESFIEYMRLSKKQNLENVKIEWTGFVLYPNINEDFCQSLLAHIQYVYTEKKQKNNVIICFTSQSDDILLQSIETMRERESEQVVPLVIIVNKNDPKKDFRKLSKVNFIPKGISSFQTANWIISKLFSIEAYYNELGSLFDKYLYEKADSYAEQGAVTTINIFLTGESRAGKSCFVNLTKGELCARESPDSTAVTMRCTEYTMPFRNTEEYMKQIEEESYEEHTKEHEDEKEININDDGINIKVEDKGAKKESLDTIISQSDIQLYEETNSENKIVEDKTFQSISTKDSQITKTVIKKSKANEVNISDTTNSIKPISKSMSKPIKKPLTKPKKNLKGRLKLIDSPGFDTDDNIPIAKNTINNYIRQAEDSKEMIHCVLYFLKEGNVFSKEKIRFLKFLHAKNLRIFFVINYANDDKKAGVTKKSIKQMVREEFGAEYDNVIFDGEDDNIVQVNLKKVGKFGKPIFGVSELYKKIYRFFRPDMYTKAFFRHLEDTEGFDKQLSILKKNTILFDKINCIEDIKEGARKKANKSVIISSSIAGAAGFIPVPMADLPVVIAVQIAMVYAIARYYEFTDDDYDVKAVLLTSGNKLTTDDLIDSIEKADSKTVKNESLKIAAKASVGGGAIALREVIKQLTKGGVMAGAGEVAKAVPIVGTLIGGMISATMNVVLTASTGRNVMVQFEKKLMDEGAQGYLKNRLLVYMDIFDQIKFLAEQKDWQTIE